MWEEIQDMPGEIFDMDLWEQQIAQQGKEVSTAPAPRQQFPRTIHGRTFETEAEYTEALHDFLNGL